MKEFLLSLAIIIFCINSVNASEHLNLNSRSAADEDWIDIGKATFMDGWVLPAFSIDQTRESNWYEVSMQQSALNENVYRLVDPYQAGPAAEHNESKNKGYIVFDISDPKHVVVNWDLVEAGFANSDLGISNLYCYNTLTYFGNYLYKGYSPKEIVDVVGNQMAYTVYADGVVTLGKYVDPDPEFSYEYYDAKFGTQENPAAGRGWQNAAGKVANMTTKIFFPGTLSVEEIHVEKTDEPEYFDITGRRIFNPAKGCLYIVRKGSKTEKIIF